MMPTLAELQTLFQRAMIDGDIAVTGLLKPPPRDTPEIRLDVYRNAYVLRLIEFLENDFEKLRLFMGAQAFTQMARDYVLSHASDHPNARWYSRRLAAFLKDDRHYRDDVLLCDLAALELAINDAFDAPDGAILTIDALAAVPPENFAAVRLIADPSVRRLTLATNAAELWPLLQEDGATAAGGHILPEPVELLVWRQDEASHFRQLTGEEAMALDAMRDGVPFGVLCEMIAMMADPDSAAMRAATYLRSWIDGGIIAGMAIDK